MREHTNIKIRELLETDAQLRQAESRWKSTGTAEALAAYLMAGRRAEGDTFRVREVVYPDMATAVSSNDPRAPEPHPWAYEIGLGRNKKGSFGWIIYRIIPGYTQTTKIPIPSISYPVSFSSRVGPKSQKNFVKALSLATKAFVKILAMHRRVERREHRDYSI